MGLQPHYSVEPKEYGGRRVVCLCTRGQDHPEALFDVPVGQEPKEKD